LVRDHIAIDIHRRADVRVPHELLLHGYWRSHSVKPRSVAVAHRVSSQLADFRYFCCFLEYSPDSRIAMNFDQVTSTGKGNDWLPLTSCNNPDYPCATPTNLTLSVVSSGLPVGSYYAEISIFEDSSPSQSMTIQVVLNVVN
jgi:hypothetical protein